MNTVRVTAYVDDRHRLSGAVPDFIPPGPVTVLIVPGPREDDAGEAWMAGVVREWAEDLRDPRQDLYTLSDGVPENGP